MVFVFKENKQLLCTVRSRLYQGENIADIIKIYTVKEYKSFDLKKFVASASYTTPRNEAYIEILNWEEESDKDDFYLLKFPVTSKLTMSAGDIDIALTFTYNDLENNKQYIIKSSTETIRIDEWNDYFKFVPDDAFASIDNKLLELDTKIQEIIAAGETIQANTPDDLKVTDQSKLHLTVDGEPIGEGIPVLWNHPDDDEFYDGELNLDVVVL